VTFEILFDKKRSFAKFNLQLKLVFKKDIGRSVRRLLAAGAILLLVFFMIRGKDPSGYFFLSVGLFYLFNAIFYFRFYFKTSRKLKKLHLELANKREARDDSTIWQFEQDHFGYKDMYFDLRVKWEAFNGYKVEEKNLFLLLGESVDQSYIIGEVEIGPQAFAELDAFVGRRLEYKG
jgi:hypothetical protein